MARNRYPGYCYCCGAYVPTGYGHFERHKGGWMCKMCQWKNGKRYRQRSKESNYAKR